MRRFVCFGICLCGVFVFATLAFSGSTAAYPNPFNPATTISYNLVEESEVPLIIFNAFGQLIRRFDFGSQEARRYTVVWDGSNQQGEKVGSGIYFLELKAGDHRLVRRLSLLK